MSNESPSDDEELTQIVAAIEELRGHSEAVGGLLRTGKFRGREDGHSSNLVHVPSDVHHSSWRVEAGVGPELVSRMARARLMVMDKGWKVSVE